jgi:cysteine desulfurase
MIQENIYLDNAATTVLDPLVLEAMMPYMTTHYGNPSSTYSLGRDTRLAIENARKTVAKILKTSPSRIFFTSGGTEANNTAIICSVRDLKCKHIVTSVLEHHATLHTVEYLKNQGEVTVSYVQLLPDGHIDLLNLEEILAKNDEITLVSLMHANNEIGNILDINRAGELCKKYNAFFQSDCVQTIGHYPIDLENLPVHFVSGAGHKFHGPKGVGILYVHKEAPINSFIHGGGQEKGMRAGTENVYGIVGFAKALELATDRFDTDHQKIKKLKDYTKLQLIEAEIGVTFNGDIDENSLYTVLNASFPLSINSEGLLMELDMMGICLSGGSACTSGGGSHVIKAIDIRHEEKVPVRFSFSRLNTTKEIDTTIRSITQLLK